MAKNNAVCLTCGKPYYKCDACDRMQNGGIVTWRANCDTRECFQLLMLALDVRDKKITDEEAYDRITACNGFDLLESDTATCEILRDSTSRYMSSKKTRSKVANKAPNTPEEDEVISQEVDE